MKRKWWIFFALGLMLVFGAILKGDITPLFPALFITVISLSQILAENVRRWKKLKG